MFKRFVKTRTLASRLGSYIALVRVSTNQLFLNFAIMDADAIIIGAGACGLMCAVQAGLLGKKVIVLEKNNKPGAKILISGGGRCNFTNQWATTEQFISANRHFLKSSFNQWTVEDTINFFETYGITGKEKTLGQLFPEDKNAKDIVEVFTSLCEEMEQDIWCNAEVKDIEQADDLIEFYNIKEPINQNRWVLINKLENKIMGTCGFHHSDRKERKVELGFELMQQYNGKGYMTEATEAIIEFARIEMKVNKIIAIVYIANSKCKRLLEKLRKYNKILAIKCIFRS